LQIKHHFTEKQFFFPNWKITTLVLGTFNPKSKIIIDYYYGRERNKFWRAIENIYSFPNRHVDNSFEKKFLFLQNAEFGCVDIIKSLEVSNEFLNNITGNGFSDSALFNQKHVKLNFQFEEIKLFLLKNKIAKVINTWGKLKGRKTFKIAIADFKQFCQENDIVYIEECPSPSGRSNSTVKEIADFYKIHLSKKTSS